MVIVAAGLSPAWQQILLFDAFVPGDVNRARESRWCGSGKVLNVGIGLAHLGAVSCTIAPLGGAARLAIESEFAAVGAHFTRGGLSRGDARLHHHTRSRDRHHHRACRKCPRARRR